MKSTLRQYLDARADAVIIFLAAYYGRHWARIMARKLNTTPVGLARNPHRCRFILDEHAVSKGFTFPTDVLDKPGAFERNLRDDLCAISAQLCQTVVSTNRTQLTDRLSPPTSHSSFITKPQQKGIKSQDAQSCDPPASPTSAIPRVES